jgi:hypothetical protein
VLKALSRWFINILLEYMAPEAHIPPSESTSTTKPEPHQTCSERPTSSLRSRMHVRAGQGYLLCQLGSIIPHIPACSATPPLKQPQTEVSYEQCALLGSLAGLPGPRSLTQLSPMDTPGIQMRWQRSPAAPKVNPDLPTSLTGPRGRPKHACGQHTCQRHTQARP